MYTLATGDTLGLLAKRFNTTVDAILSLNQMTNPDVVTVGQQLKIPGEAPPELGGYGAYTVQAGDTLSSIARLYNMTMADLQKLNGITNPDVMTPGQVLKVPGIAASAGSTPAVSATSVPAAPARLRPLHLHGTAGRYIIAYRATLRHDDGPIDGS